MMKRILAVAVAFWLGTLPAFADSTIDALGAAAGLSGTESVPIFQTANPAVKTTATAIGNTANALNTSALTAGTLAAARMPALTGDCVTAAGAVATTCNVLGHPGYLVSNWYLPTSVPGPVVTGSTGTANIIKCSFGVVNTKLTINALGVAVQTTSGNLQFALYTNVSGRPGVKIANTVNIVSASTSVSGALTANKQVGPGGTDAGRELWFCYNMDNATIVLNSYAVASGQNSGTIIGSPTLANTASATGMPNAVSCAGAACQGGTSTFNTTPAWPADLTSSTWSEVTTKIMPAIAFQVNSVP